MPRDPYLRSWVKFQTYMLEQSQYQRLTLEQVGVFAKAILYSTRGSQDIGYFCDRETGRHMTLEEIAYRIKPDVGDSAEWLRRIELAFDAFIAAGLMAHDEANGWHFVPEVFEQFLHENNLTAKREADARRQRNKRDRDNRRGKGKPPVRLVRGGTESPES